LALAELEILWPEPDEWNAAVLDQLKAALTPKDTDTKGTV
jgi:hypothetical protein